MNLGENLTKSFDYAKLLFADFGKLLLLIILDIIPVVNLIVVGYLGNVLKEPNDSTQLPPLDKYGDLWIQGLKIVLASVILLLIPLLLAGPALFLIVCTWFALPNDFYISSIITIPLFYLGLALAFFFAAILSMAIVNMLKKNSFGAAFAIGDALTIIRKIGWGSYLVWLVVIFICTAVVSAIVGNLPIIGWFVGTILAPAIGVFFSRSVSLVYHEGTAEEQVQPTETV